LIQRGQADRAGIFAELGVMGGETRFAIALEAEAGQGAEAIDEGGVL
jgi:hypothetical protein